MILTFYETEPWTYNGWSITRTRKRCTNKSRLLSCWLVNFIKVNISQHYLCPTVYQSSEFGTLRFFHLLRTTRVLPLDVLSARTFFTTSLITWTMPSSSSPLPFMRSMVSPTLTCRWKRKATYIIIINQILKITSHNNGSALD